ncbi:hypothetical protein [Deinococcus sp. S9]|uniref:hypothetical protein n=1 Tax=Deinococcus sp. S9 TaxID=2545754 RepID=UPI001055712A|nr:hypothetical protein [Deinococcus sp. S9]TDE84684.1 hypothetical protein E0686_15800 [Deinococcus sp. S9]
MNLKEKADRAYRAEQLKLQKHDARFRAVAAKIAEVFGEDAEEVYQQGERVGYDTLRVGGLSFLGKDIVGKAVDTPEAPHLELDGTIKERAGWAVSLECKRLLVVLTQYRTPITQIISFLEEASGELAKRGGNFSVLTVEVKTPADAGKYLAMKDIYASATSRDDLLPEESLTDPTR